MLSKDAAGFRVWSHVVFGDPHASCGVPHKPLLWLCRFCSSLPLSSCWGPALPVPEEPGARMGPLLPQWHKSAADLLGISGQWPLCFSTSLLTAVVQLRLLQRRSAEAGSSRTPSGDLGLRLATLCSPCIPQMFSPTWRSEPTPLLILCKSCIFSMGLLWFIKQFLLMAFRL